MKPLRLLIAFALFASCLLFCLWGAGVIPLEQANETLKRVLLVGGGIGVTLVLVYFVMSVGAGKASVASDASAKPTNSGPQF